MMTRRHLLIGSAASLAATFAPLSLRLAGAAEQASRATVLFDAFGAPSGLRRTRLVSPRRARIGFIKRSPSTRA